MKFLFLLLAPVLVLATFTSHDASDLTADQQWQILTKQNFSSQIRLHHHILLLVTLPWSGESRSLMKEITQLVSDRVESFGSLKLRVVHKNSEKMLVESISAGADDITILYYHYTVSYKYRGRLRAKTILNSLEPHMSLASEEFPLKALKTPEELKDFTDSTDEALVLFEFCGWTPKLLAKEKKNGTGTGDSLSGYLLGMGFSRKADHMLVTRRRNNQKVAGQEMCKDDIGIAERFGVLSWLGQFSTENGSTPSEMIDNRRPQISSSCSYKEFQRFHSFYSNFIKIVREYFLPPEKHRFGLVSETSLLSSLDFVNPGSWFAMRSVSGCPSCLKIFKEEADFKYSQTDNSVVKELEGSGYDLVPILPPNLPSVILFIDRSSDVLEVRETSREALSALRELASFYKAAPKICQNSAMDRKSSFQIQGMENESKHSKLKRSLPGQRNKLKEEKSTLMIVHENQLDHFDKITTDLNGGSLHEILNYFLQQKKGKKLSSVAKNLGFQLLSDDIDIKVVNSENMQSFNQLVPDTSTEGILANYRQGDDGSVLRRVTKTAKEPEGSMISADVKVCSRLNEVKANPGEDNSQGIISVDGEKFISDNEEPSLVANEKAEEEPPIMGKKLISDNEPYLVANEKGEEHPIKGPKLISNDVSSLIANEKREDEPYVWEKESREEHNDSICFNGSFFFSDGDYQLLNSLSGDSKIPALVIVDPIKQQHHVFPAEMNFSYALIHDYLLRFLSGSLPPHVRSDSGFQSPRQTIYPPFVNLDFHEVDSVPRITSNTFIELAIGFNQSQNERAFRAWSNDVLVLFTNSWCGFCQRMELIVRELYRAVRGYKQMVDSRNAKDKTVPNFDKLKDPNVKLPLVYLIDCTLNDCSLILKSINQSEAYPALVLFPAEKKNPILYDGDMAVADIIQFIADRGNNSHHLINEQALWMPKKGGGNDKLYEEVSELRFHSEPHLVKNIPEEATVEARTGRMDTEEHKKKSQISDGLQERSSRIAVGSILIATENLLGSQPFDQSKILIVAADGKEGFQGLIINKKLEWNVLQELEGLERFKEAPLSFGGPLIKHGMPLVALTRRFHRKSIPEILPGIYFLDQLATIGEFESLRLRNQSVSDYWFFLGYSSWGWDQLFDEIAAGAWNISDDIAAHLNWP